MPRPFMKPDSLCNLYANGRAVGYKFMIHNNRYRNVPVSCIEKLTIKVDGKPVDPLYVHFCINGKKLQPSELRDMYNEYWGMMNPAVIEIDQLDGLLSGPHEIEVKLLSRSGYIEAPLCVVDNEREPHMYPTQDSGGAATLWLQK